MHVSAVHSSPLPLASESGERQLSRSSGMLSWRWVVASGNFRLYLHDVSLCPTASCVTNGTSATGMTLNCTWSQIMPANAIWCVSYTPHMHP